MRQWVRVRVLLEGATEPECGEAVEEMIQEFQQREYLRNIAVDWDSQAGGPVFQLEVEAGDAERAREFLLDEVFEVGAAFLPDIDEFSVEVLDSELLELEEIWISTPVLTISHWPAHAIAIIAGLICAFLTVFGFSIESPPTIVFFFAWFMVCLWLLVSYGKTVLTEEGIIHSALRGNYAIGWDEIKAGVIDSGGNTVVLKGDGKQLVLPHFWFWAGRERIVAEAAFFDELERRNVKLKRGYAAFAISRRTRV